MKGLTAGLIFAVLAGATPVAAQSAQKDTAHKGALIPADARPPKGMCRIWIDAVPAAQQPAATDCRTAVKNLPPNGRILFGDDFTDSSKTKASDKYKLPPNVKGFTGVSPASPVVIPKRPPE
ncbi:MAG: hypothetical protein ACREPM_24210 [Gemmatimonadaceae bacterium]